jgi:hypothetical protein
VLDVVARGQGLDVDWKPRWARFYPFSQAFAFRFEGDTYDERFVELISDHVLRDPETDIVVLD